MTEFYIYNRRQGSLFNRCLVSTSSRFFYRRLFLQDTGTLDCKTTSQLIIWDYTNTCIHPDVCQSLAPSIQESHAGARSTFLIKVDYEPFVVKGDDVLRLDVEVGKPWRCRNATPSTNWRLKFAISLRNIPNANPRSRGVASQVDYGRRHA